MKILGIDPGIERLGWGIVEKNGSQLARIRSGVKKTSKNQKEDERLWEIFVFLDKLIKKEKPNAVSTEKLFFLAIARKHHLPIKEFAPLGMKMAICGYGRADKRAVANMVKLMLNLPQKELLDDETDALALAIAGTSYPSFP